MKKLKREPTAWALMYKFDWGYALLGKYCWMNAPLLEGPIKTFYTRREAREAKKTCCYKRAVPVKVKIVLA